MGALFFLIIVGIVFSGRFIGDRASSFDLAQKEKREKEILCVISCNNRIGGTGCKIPPPTTSEERWEMIESVKNDLVYIFGEDWKIFFNEEYGVYLKPDITNSFRSPWGIAYEVWLSSKGYVDQTIRPKNEYDINAASCGIDLLYPSQEVDNERPAYIRSILAQNGFLSSTKTHKPLVTHEDGCNIRIRACKVIERNLKNMHPDLSKELTLLQYREPNGEWSMLDKLLVWKFDPILGDSKNCIRIWSALK